MRSGPSQSQPAPWPAASTSGGRLLVEAVLVLAAAFLFTLALAPDAPFNRELGVCEAGAVRDVLAGHLILPSFEPGVEVHTPPLYWWMAALSTRVLGIDELALRLPSLMAAALICAILFLWGAAVASRRAGLIAAAAVMFGHFFAEAARQPRMDMMLALFVTMAVLALERAIAPRARARLGWLAAGTAAMVAGTLSKGPLGLLLPGLVLALFLLVRGRLRELFGGALIAAFTAAFALGLLWYLAAYRVGGEKFLRWQIETGLLRRFIPTRMGGYGFCAHPFYYFIPRVIGGSVPWSAYLPALALVFARGLPARWRPGFVAGGELSGAGAAEATGGKVRAGSARLAEPLVFTGCWFVAIFGFFSASAGKCLIYILPAFVPLAAMIGILFDEAARGGDRLAARWLGGASAVIGAGALVMVAAAALAALSGVPASLVARLHPSDRQFLAIAQALGAGAQPPFVLWVLLSSAGGFLALIGVPRSRLDLQAIGVTAVAAAGVLFWFGSLNPARAHHISLKSFAAQVDRLLPADTPADYVGVADCDLVFYSRHRIGHIDRLGPSAPGRFLLLWQDRFATLSPAEHVRLEILAESKPVDRHGRRLLVRERETLR